MRSDTVPVDSFERIGTLAQLLAWRASRSPDEPAFAFLGRGLEVEDTDSYASLGRAAAGVAAALADAGVAPGDPVILAAPPGLAFVRALWGIWAAGAVAVPGYPIASERGARRLERIAAETGARTVLAPPPPAAVPLGGLAAARWIDPATVAEAGALPPPFAAAAGDPALIQYTSGSLAAPKGVVLTHANILDNALRIRSAFFHTSKSRGLIWLPPYHDMGLMGGIVQPVFTGFRTSLMAPRTFLRQPLNWLRAVTLTRATTSGGPNFAYEACLSVPDAAVEAAGIDLRSWTVAFNGAEPVSAATLHAFERKFEPFGFRMRSFMPCYGLAEATLYVTGASKLGLPTFLRVDREALRRRTVRVADEGGPQSRILVSCGPAEANLRIVRPEDGRPGRTTEIGEIWVSGASVGAGYRGRPELSDSVFAATLGRDPTPYLRTGDLGFLHGGELYVTGRLKDLIIVRGQNHHPEDIEATVRAALGDHGRLPAAAFTLPAEDGAAGERLIVVQEVERGREATAGLGLGLGLVERIREAVAAEHGVAVSGVVLARRGGVPRTASGKLQRAACRDRLLAGDLDTLLVWNEAGAIVPTVRPAEPPPVAIRVAAPRLAGLDRAAAAAVLSEWLMHVVGDAAQIAVADLDADTHFGLYGLDSLTAIAVTAHVADALGIEVEDTAFWDYPNFTLFGTHLADRLADRLAVSRQPAAHETAPA
ncbi:AMP-binding protein [Azospirillum argentinense]